MTKYRVFLKGGTVLEVEAETTSTNEFLVNFYDSATPGATPSGSFPLAEIYGYFKSEHVKWGNASVLGINPVK